MSLVGSLEDLGLADILQIVSLAQKSGRLAPALGWRERADPVAFAGLVCGGAVKGERRQHCVHCCVEGAHVPAGAVRGGLAPGR